MKHNVIKYNKMLEGIFDGHSKLYGIELRKLIVNELRKEDRYLDHYKFADKVLRFCQRMKIVKSIPSGPTNRCYEYTGNTRKITS